MTKADLCLPTMLRVRDDLRLDDGSDTCNVFWDMNSRKYVQATEHKWRYVHDCTWEAWQDFKEVLTAQP